MLIDDFNQLVPKRPRLTEVNRPVILLKNAARVMDMSMTYILSEANKIMKNE